jgi:tetratricopeptide (TPR) repeat protein
MAAVILAAGVAWARSPFAVEVETFSQRYHEDPARLDLLRKGLGEAVASNPRPEDLTALAQVCFIWGDVRARTSDQKLDAYDQGRQAARRAIELEPRNAVAHLWYATNTARWGQTKGILRSLFLLPTVQEEIQRVLTLDPGLVPVYALAGNVYYEVPALLGGDIGKAEEMFRKGLELDPSFTGMRVGLAKTLIRRGRIAEARRELQAVLQEKAPHNLADWTMKDAKEARELLESIQASS